MPNMVPPVKRAPEYEQLLLIGERTDVDSICEKLRLLCRVMGKEDAELFQLWWRGQRVGASLVNRPESENAIAGALGPKLGEGLFPSAKRGFFIRKLREGPEELWELSEEGARLLAKGASACHEAGELSLGHLITCSALDEFVCHPTAFEQLCQQDDLEPFFQQLKKLTWDEQDLEAWWRCSTNWLMRDQCLDSDEWVFGRSILGDEEHQAKVLTALAQAIPKPLVDVERAESLVSTHLQGLSVTAHYSDEVWAGSHWIRILVGEDRAWKVWGATVGFLNKTRPSAVEWFARLSEQAQFDALEQAHSQYSFWLSEGLNPENVSVNRQIENLVEICPQWHWDPVLEVLSKSKRTGALPASILARRQAQKAQEKLEEVLPCSGTRATRPRM